MAFLFCYDSIKALFKVGTDSIRGNIYPMICFESHQFSKESKEYNVKRAMHREGYFDMMPYDPVKRKIDFKLQLNVLTHVLENLGIEVEIDEQLAKFWVWMSKKN